MDVRPRDGVVKHGTTSPHAEHSTRPPKWSCLAATSAAASRASAGYLADRPGTGSANRHSHVLSYARLSCTLGRPASPTPPPRDRAPNPSPSLRTCHRRRMPRGHVQTKGDFAASRGPEFAMAPCSCSSVLADGRAVGRSSIVVPAPPAATRGLHWRGAVVVRTPPGGTSGSAGQRPRTRPGSRRRPACSCSPGHRCPSR